MSTRLPIGNRKTFQLALPSIGQILYFFYFQETKTKKNFKYLLYSVRNQQLAQVGVLLSIRFRKG